MRKRKALNALGVLTILAVTLLLAFSTNVGTVGAATRPNKPVYDDASIRIPVVKVTGEAAQANSYEGTGEVAVSDGAELGLDREAMLKLPGVSAPVGIESVIGADRRQQVFTNGFPARAVALITFTGGRCTGWMIGSNTVATAGHCVHTGGPGGNWRPRLSFRVSPGYTGTSAPFGTCTAKWLASVTGWTVNGDERFDYGVVKLNCTVGNSTGWFGFWWQAASLTGLDMATQGYPGDKPLTQWISSDRIRTTLTDQIFYRADTTGGQSGSPVWEDREPGSAFCTGACAMGIHAYGLHGAAPHSTDNHGKRITQATFNNLIAWRNAP